MSDKTSIEWTDATWNPVTGCTKVSPGCDHCYAETLAERFRGTPGHYFERGFDVQLRPGKLDQPLHWRRPRRVFVNSMSDLFHDDVPDEYIGSVFEVMAKTSQHTFQVLTKRPGRMRSLLKRWAAQGEAEDWAGPGTAIFRRADKVWVGPIAWPLPNVWLGVSAEDQRWADVRIPVLAETPAAVRFVSAEPLLGPIDFTHWTSACVHDRRFGSPRIHSECESSGERSLLDWVIVGGESGRGARPMNMDWVRSVRDQCRGDDVAFLYKQQGSGDGGPKSRRKLDGRTWDEFPVVAA